MAAPPFSFSELRNSVFYHNIRVYIFGTDVTPWLNGSIVISRAGRNGINMCQFSLSNPLDAFSMTDANLTPADGVSYDRADAILTGEYRTIDPFTIGGAYSELAKFQVVSRKLTQNLRHAVNTFGPVRGATSGGQILTDKNHSRDDSQVQSDFTDRYPFSVGSLCFHKYDPVRIFVQDPFRRTQDAWTCEFAGFIDTKPYTQNYVNGLSLINFTCQDLRLMMQNMRVQINPLASVGFENTLLAQGDSKKNLPETIDAGYFNDLIPPTSTISHVLGGQTFKQSVENLLFGISRGGQSVGAVGKLTSGQTFNFDPAKSDNDSKIFLENWNNLVLFGSKIQTKGNVTTGGYLTETQMMEMGTDTIPGGNWAPENAQVHFLYPADGTPLSNLVSFASGDSRVAARIEWESRLDLLTKVCSGIDYQMYISGLGDVIFEFPFYDFLPTHFNETYNNLYTFHKHLIQDSINDEGGQPITALRVTSQNLREEISQGNPETEGTDTGVASSVQLVRTVFSNVLASRMGVQVETHSLPGITDPARLTQLAFIEFNKRLSQFNKWGFDATFRPYLGVNRPIYNGAKQRLGITESVNYTYQIRDEVTMTLDLAYTRKKEKDGRFRFITGGEKVPISYNTIFDNTGVRVKGQGVSVDKEPPAAPTPTVTKGINP